MYHIYVWICQRRCSCCGLDEWCLTETHITAHLGPSWWHSLRRYSLAEESPSLGQPWRIPSLTPLAVCTSSPCFLCIDERCNLPASCSRHRLLCLPFPQWTLTLETTSSQNKLLHQLTMVLVFSLSNRKVTKTKPNWNKETKAPTYQPTRNE